MFDRCFLTDLQTAPAKYLVETEGDGQPPTSDEDIENITGASNEDIGELGDESLGDSGEPAPPKRPIMRNRG